MPFASWCALRADLLRTGLNAAMTDLYRARIVRERQAHVGYIYDQVEVGVVLQARRPRRQTMCRNHPDKWAQRGSLCTHCYRAATGDTRTTRERQTAQWRGRLASRLQ